MKRNKIFIAITIFSVLLYAQAAAADTVYGVNPLPVELTYAGSYKNQPLLQLNISGSKEENQYRITVTDQSGIVLYTANVRSEESFSKQFLLNTEDLGDAILNFAVTGLKSGKTVTYQVSNQEKISGQKNVVKL